MMLAIVDHPIRQSFASACSGIYKSETAGNQFPRFGKSRSRPGVPAYQNRIRPTKTSCTPTTSPFNGPGKTWRRNREIVVNDVMHSNTFRRYADRGAWSWQRRHAEALPSNHGGPARFAFCRVEEGTIPAVYQCR
jgi:hypothetical protein